jgi:hypothetical protein
MKNETRGYWCDIEPKGLARKHHDHPWHFGQIQEAPSQRSDSNWYSALLFRNEDRTVFGIQEYVGKDLPHHKNIRQMATRVVMEKDFRDSLVTDDPDVKDVWKKR